LENGFEMQKQIESPIRVIIGDKERDSNTLTIEGRNDTKIEGMNITELIEKLQKEITERTLN
jgi:threonyl-tRNA synthetase